VTVTLHGEALVVVVGRGAIAPGDAEQQHVRVVHHGLVRRVLFETVNAVPNSAPNYNGAPTQQLPVVRLDEEGRRSLDLLRWGLIPFWAKDSAIGMRCINAMAETAAAKPAFRDAFRRRRCLVPVDGFYEWQKRSTGKKQPYAIVSADGKPFAMAGLWENWKEPQSGETVRTFTIITGPPNELVAPIHNRMPVILPPSHCRRLARRGAGAGRGTAGAAAALSG
jgi:putative SOS response-associated peptidase YedK